MRSSAHAESSAKIFGGKPEDYSDIHNIIDLNKAVHASVTGRFFMHHYDVGGAILETMFGKEIINSAAVPVAVKDVMLQHLIEDYGQVPMMTDWLATLINTELGDRKMPIIKPFQEAYVSLLEANLVPEGRERETLSLVKRVREVVTLEAFTERAPILQHPNRACVFGHYTGLDLLKKIINPKDQVEDDLIVHSMEFLLSTESGLSLHEDSIPSLVDWMKWVVELPWMRRPEGMERHDTDFVISKMKEIKDDGEQALGIKTGKFFPQEHDWNDPEKCRGGRLD